MPIAKSQIDILNLKITSQLYKKLRLLLNKSVRLTNNVHSCYIQHVVPRVNTACFLHVHHIALLVTYFFIPWLNFNMKPGSCSGWFFCCLFVLLCYFIVIWCLCKIYVECNAHLKVGTTKIANWHESLGATFGNIFLLFCYSKLMITAGASVIYRDNWCVLSTLIAYHSNITKISSLTKHIRRHKLTRLD